MARLKNRGTARTIATPSVTRWKLGKYIRLSKEDLNRGHDESNSVANQKRLLDDYYEQHTDEFENAGNPYIDDGYTGTDINRAGFQKLLADIYAQKVTCVIVKDLSRLSRNYTDAGSLIENLFVQMKIRFISLAEGIDSYRNPDSVSNLMVPITNVINDNFCYQTSKKVRQVFDYKRRSGEFIGSFAAYGYKKDPHNKHTLIVDEEAAEVVQNIYSCFLDGMSKNAIVRQLNSQGILCPSEYKKKKGLNYQNPHLQENPLWGAKTVGDILQNPLYTGTMVQGRYRIKSYKIHKQERVPPGEWFIVENTHKAIINQETFKKVQQLLLRDTRTAPKRQELYLFSGFLRCADCGRAMARSEVKGRVYYFCRTYKDRSKTACAKHSVKHLNLEAAVLYTIRQYVYLTVNYAKVIEQINSAPLQKSPAVRLDGLIEAKRKELAKIRRYKQAVYQDWKDGKITHDDYRYMDEDYDKQTKSIGVVLDNLIAEKAELTNSLDDENPFLAAFRKYENIDKLTREVLIEVVEQIKVHENGNISVQFKFANELRGIIDLLHNSDDLR